MGDKESSGFHKLVEGLQEFCNRFLFSTQWSEAEQVSLQKLLIMEIESIEELLQSIEYWREAPEEETEQESGDNYEDYNERADYE